MSAVRPTPAIETIAYFCVAELLANAAKHSSAKHLAVRAAGERDVLLISVADDADVPAQATQIWDVRAGDVDVRS